MGLDMFLNAKRYLSDYDVADRVKKEAMMELFPELKAYVIEEYNPIEQISAQVGYWRKANAIHNWFVQNVQGGKDNCANYYVSRIQLLALKSFCEQVLADNSLAEKLLPPVSGFFFGNTEINKFYFSDLESTVKIIDGALALSEDWEFEYHSSW